MPVLRWIGAVAAALVSVVVLPPTAAYAAAALTVSPLTWDVIGLDSNDVTTGPARFPVAARVCNTGDATATGVVASFAFTTVNAFISLAGPATVAKGNLAPGGCADAYFEVAIARTAAAYGTSRGYRISAQASGVAASATPAGRQLYVEQILSQNRNSVVSISGPATVYLGQTYTFTLVSDTAPNGYEQLESFLTFPASMLELLAVDTTYTAPPGTNDSVYGDGCGWQPDPALPGYLSCVGPPNYPGGKVGGAITTVYTVRVLATGTATLSGLVYDLSGGSFHYNTDFGQAPNEFIVTAIEPPDLAVTKTGTLTGLAGAEGRYTMTVVNVGSSATTGAITLTDALPAGAAYLGVVSPGWRCTAAASMVTCTHPGPLAAGATLLLTLRVRLPAAVGAATDVVTVRTPNDFNPGNDTDRHTTTVIAPPVVVVAPPRPMPRPELPATGRASALLALLGGALVLAGSSCVVAGRRLSGGVVVGATRADDLAVGQQLAEVLEDDDAVAQQAPALFRMRRDDACGVMVGRVRGRAGWLVGAHGGRSWLGPRWSSGLSARRAFSISPTYNVIALLLRPIRLRICASVE